MIVSRYRVTGSVQGVGFRPFLHKLAAKHKLKGWVINDSKGVLLEVEGGESVLKKFATEIKESAPSLARIDNVIQKETNTKPGSFKSFEIKSSVKQRSADTIITPDNYVCKDCLNDIFDKSNRRFRYPFTNCTNCGPRYSIIKGIPYDRCKTTMSKFKMCVKCQKEYEDICDRRYHAQPNACPSCGPQLILTNNKGKEIKATETLKFCIKKLKEGKILAIKSIGGFHLAVDAQNDATIKELRKRKKRDSRPFALMARDIETAKKYVNLSEKETEVMASCERPIVIVEKKKKKGRETLPLSIAPGAPNYGLMLPSAPLHYLLLDDPDLPVLIMTSGNISGEPIVYKNKEALSQLGHIADYFLLNNRGIHTRVDDSIVRCISNKKIEDDLVYPIRRSRGFAPYPIKLSKKVRNILAVGSELKNTIALSKGNHVFISHHIGDLKNDQIFKSHNDCIKHLQNLFTIKPEAITCDLHPGFKSTVSALKQNDLPVIQVQHHYAHMASCMGENNLYSSVIGVIMDGTGYGTDGTIWGGEFLIGDLSEFTRVGSVRNFNMLGGDKAVEEPYRIAIDLLNQTFGKNFMDHDLEFFKSITPEELNVYSIMSQKKLHTFTTSSMGRLFDGVSALLNVCTRIEYEAQAAIELESLLNRDLTIAPAFSYKINKNNDMLEIDYRDMIKDIVSNLMNHESTINQMSRRFHSTIVDMILKMCSMIREAHKINDIVLSGGVFMNEFIFVNSLHLLKALGFNVYFHEKTPPNDGGVCLGQIMVANAILGKNK